MESNLAKTIATLGILATSYAIPQNALAQEVLAQDLSSYGNIPSLESRPEMFERDLELERYSRWEHEMSRRESLRNVADLNTRNIEKLEWLVDVHNNPLSHGDRITIIEKRSSDGIYYPYSINVDYADFDKEDILFIGTEQDLGYALRVDYHDEGGLHRRSLWTNKRNHSFYDVTVYGVEFPLEGFFEDYSISSPYGPRNNPILDTYGGPDTHIHWGIDIPLITGTPIIAPLDGTMNAGYVGRNIGDGGYDTFKNLGKMSEIYSRRIVRNENRQREIQNIRFQFFHLSDYPEYLKDEFVENKMEERANYIPRQREEEFRDWYRWVLSEQDEEEIYKNLQNHSMSSYRFGNVNVKKGEEVSYSGNTGFSSAPHIHIGVIVNGSYVDPEDFFNMYGKRRGVDREVMQERINNYNLINNALVNR